MNLGMPPVDYEIRKQDKCTCSYCDLSGNGNFDIWMNLSIDHIVPGSGDGAENKTVACGECNTLKGMYKPNGTNREERIADARRYVRGKRELYRYVYEKMMGEIAPSRIAV